ncbi:MAG: beta strand repeat-containing protein, partial [Planctomycetia bacterium]
MVRQTNLAMFAAGIVVVTSAAASAQSYTWSGTSTNFNLGTNWSGTSVPSFPVNSGTMTFVGNPTFQPQLTASATVGVLSFGTNSASPNTTVLSSASSDYVLGLTGGQVVYFEHNAPATISANLAFLGSASGTQTIVSNAIPGTLSGVLSGSVGTLRLEAGSGSRNVTISGTSNSFSSTPLFQAGLVNVTRLGNASQNSSLGTSGTLVFNSGGYLASSGTGESSDKYLMVASGVGGLGGGSSGNSPGFFNAILSGGASNLGGQTATLHLHGSGTMSGKITQTVGSGSLSVIAGGATLTLSNTASDFAGTLSVRRSQTLITPMFGMTGSASPLGTNGRVMLSHVDTNTGDATLRFSGASDTSDKTFTLNFTGGNATLDTGTGTLTLTNTAAWGGGGAGSKTINLTGSGVGSLAAGLPNSSSGSNSLVKAGSGSWEVSGANTFTGATSIQAGRLTFAKRVALYNGGTASWLKANINTTASGTATLGLGVGGADGFTNVDITTLIGALTGDVSTGGMRATSSWGFDTTNTGSTFTVADTIANTTTTGTFTGGGAIGVTKLGSGTLTLSGTNTYTFGTRTDGGVLTITNTAALGSGTGFLSFTGGTLDLANLTLTRDGSVTATAGRLTNGVLTGSAGLTKSGGGTFRIDSTANTFMGATAIQDGVVEVPSIAAAGLASSLGSGTGANATINLGNLGTSGTLRYIGTTSATTNRTLNLSGTTGGGAIENDGDGALVMSSAVTVANGSKTLALGGTGTAANTIGAIGEPGTGDLSVVKDGPGLWRLTGVSTFEGGLTVRNGTVVATVNSGGGTDAGVFGKADNLTVGNSAVGATGTATLLLAPGVISDRVLKVPSTTGGQAVVLGGEAAGTTS